MKLNFLNNEYIIDWLIKESYIKYLKYIWNLHNRMNYQKELNNI